MNAGVRKYKAVQALAHKDARTAGQRRADARDWARPTHRPLTRINAPAEPTPAALTKAQLGVLAIGWCACMAFGMWLAGWL